MNRVALAGLAILLLLGAAWWWLGAPQAGRDREATVAHGNEAEPRLVAGTSSLAAADANQEFQTGISERSEVAATAGPPPLLTVRVVKESGGPGIPGVTVRMVDWDDPANADLLALRHDFLRDREADVQSFGVLTVSGADGRVQFARPEACRLYARHGAFWADQHVDWNSPSECELLLQTDLELRVLVLDADDRPVADAPVAWLGWSMGSARDRIQARSGADGIARLRHLQSRLPMQPGQRSTVALALPGGIEGQVAFDPASPPPEPIVLRLPPSGSVTVTVLDADQRPLPDGTIVILQTALDDAQKEVRSDDRYVPSPRDEQGAAVAWTTDGEAHFPYVSIGRRLEAMAYHQELRAYFGAEDAGLLAPGEHRRIEVRLATAPTVLVGLLLRPDRSPIAKARISVNLCSDGRSQESRVSTDADGRFRLVLDEAKHPASAARVCWFAHTDAGPERLLLARVALHDPLGAGDAELGEIVLGDGGVIASGTVVDEAGKPLAGVRIGIAPAGASDFPAIPADPRRGSNFTAADGRFAVAGAAVGQIWSMSFEAEGRRRTEHTVAAGTTGMIVTMESMAPQVLGRLWLDPEIPHDLLELSWRPQELGNVSPRAITLAADGSLTVRDAPAGVGTLFLRSRRLTEVLVAIPELALGVGAPLDPRLDPLDLRGRLHDHEVHVAGPGALTPVLLAAQVTREPPVIENYLDNPLRFLTAEREREITVYAPAAAATTVRLSGGKTTVQLQPGRIVHWELLGAEWKEAGAKIRLAWTRPGAGSPELDVCALDEHGRGTGTLPGPGVYGLRLSYVFEVDGVASTWTSEADALTPAGEAEFHVGPGDEPVHLQFQLKDGAVARARKAVEP